ncbi:FRG domain-containing protein [Acinetobacter schindleri]|uniref:FRG domain-containing protein n=1 Tax=Acinetobacter schindleri TaxID=108981 RepID=UPI001D1797E4|nr:FRG domain-containing protein [Acinetobacter schindleri]
MGKNNSMGVAAFLEKLNEYKYDRGKNIYFFRGHSDLNYKLIPNIYRENIIKHEHILFKELLLRCPQDFEYCKTTFELLVKMQHYSLPTRLLDITTNPLVALYFACQSKPKCDGEIIIFEIPTSNIKYYDSDTVSILSNLSRVDSNFGLPTNLDKDVLPFGDEYDEMIVKFNNSYELRKLIYEIQSEKPHFVPRMDPDVLSKVLCVKPKMDNPRVIRQDGAFFLFGIEGYKNKPAEIDQKYILSKENKIIIPANSKERLIKNLELLGITEATIFPEIDRVASYIRKNYSN